MSCTPREPENQTRQSSPEQMDSSGTSDTEAGLRRAVLVIHGIGQQRRFETLDRFTNGMRKALSAEVITHLTQPRGTIFDHSIRLEGDCPIDIYEYHWAPVTRGKSSFTAVLNWLYATGLTPLRRFAFNLSLLIRQAHKRSERADNSLRVWAAALFGGEIGSKIAWGKFVLLASWLFVRELLRVVYVLVLVMLVIGGAALLIGSSGDLFESAKVALSEIDVSLLNWNDYVTALLFIGALVAFITLGWSLPRQVRDLDRLLKSAPALIWRLDPLGLPSIILAIPAALLELTKEGFTSLKKKLFGHVESTSISDEEDKTAPIAKVSSDEEPSDKACASKPPLDVESRDDSTKSASDVVGKGIAAALVIKGIYKGIDTLLGPSIRKWSEERQEKRYWRAEITGRIIYLVFSALLLWPIYALLSVLIDASYECALGFCLSAIIYEIVGALGRDGMLSIVQIAFLLLLSALCKRVFVDYVADVALYTTTDERSLHADTRRTILEGAVGRLRWLIRNYDSVVVVGHSLGSVIAYDAINHLSNEARRPYDEGVTGPADWIDADMLERLDVLVTFGSPLNKVLYFFRNTVKSYETIRSHILHGMYSFRLPKELLTSDPSIRDGASSEAEQQDQESQRQLLSSLVWLNVSSPLDPVSAPLLFFEGVRECRRWYLLPGFCHMSYWHDPGFYAQVTRTIFPERAKKVTKGGKAIE